MADKRISQLVERIDIANNDVLPIVASGATTTNKVTISSIQTFMQGNLDLGVTSVGLSMPSAFSVSNSPVTTSGNISVTGAGTTAQYIRGDGSLADFPASSGGGSSVSYYLNGSVSQGTIGGVDYQELSKVPILGAGTDFTINANGYIASFITDIFEPNLLEIPGGNWNFETYFQASSGGGSPTFYVELYKVSYPTGTATLIASNSGTPELIAFGTTIHAYFSTLAVPTTTLALTDRLALRYYVANSGRTITMHTENNTLCQIITTFSTGLTALNGLTAQVQNFATGTNGTDFNIESASTTHVFNLPTASGTNRGALSSTDWTTFNGKVGGTGASGQVAFWNGTSSQTGDNGLFWDNTNKRLGVGTTTPEEKTTLSSNTKYILQLQRPSGTLNDAALIRFSNSTTSNVFSSYIGSIRGEIGRGILVFGTNNSGGLSDNISENMRIAPGGNVLINTTTDAGFRLDVNGTARVQGVATITADSSVNNVAIGRGGGAVISNTRLGNGALSANTSGSTNTALGGDALGINTTGNSSTAVGYFALASNNANLNTAIGRNALSSNTTGGSNTAIGGNVMSSNITGSGNTAIGNNAGRYIADGTTGLTVSTNSIFLGASSRANADNETNQIVIGTSTTGLGSNTTVIGNSSTTFGRWFGNLLVGSSTNSGQQLQVTGTSLLNGLSTIQGTTASDSGQLGAELLTTGTGDASWTGTSFATGYTHVAGSTTTLTSTLAGVVSTFYQITYTVTGRTAGSFTIDFGGFTSSALTATGAVGPRATTTGTLVITPTSDFNGTIVLSIRVISISSASVTFNNSLGAVTNQIRISSISTNTFIGLNSGRNNTTGGQNSFFGQGSGLSNTTGISNSFFGALAGQNNTTANNGTFIGRSAGLNNTTGGSNTFIGVESGRDNTTGTSNCFFGVSSGNLNTTGGSNAFFGVSSGAGNTTGGNNAFFGTSSGLGNTTGVGNSFFGENAALNNTTGSQNSFFGRNAGRFISDGTTANTIANDSVFIGAATRANANNQTNQIVIGNSAIGLGSNTTVLGNTSTTFGRWYGSLLLGTTTNAASSILTMESTTQGFLPPRMTTTQKNAIASPATGLVVYDNTLNKLSVFTGLVWETVTSL
jgi:hypothetical protein